MLHAINLHNFDTKHKMGLSQRGLRVMSFKIEKSWEKITLYIHLTTGVDIDMALHAEKLLKAKSNQKQQLKIFNVGK